VGVRRPQRPDFRLDRIRAATGRGIRLAPEEVNALEAHLEARRQQRPFYDARMASIYDLEGIDAFPIIPDGSRRSTPSGHSAKNTLCDNVTLVATF
jgi:hypothetical protein